MNSLGEMVKMIQGMRTYESAQKLIQTLDHMTETAIQDIGPGAVGGIMIRAMWTAATGMTAQQLNVDTIAHNLANVNTNAFKRSRAEFADLLYQIQRFRVRTRRTSVCSPSACRLGAGVRPITVAKEWMQGNMRQTSNESGPGHRRRQDSFRSLGRTARLCIPATGRSSGITSGILLRATATSSTPVITIPSGALKIDIGQDGTVSALLPGVTQASQVGQIQLVRFDNPSGLVATGNNLFLDSFASGPALQGTGGFSTGFGTIQQGFLESSNVNLAEEMVNMIIAQRSYEINSKTIQASDEMMPIANNLRR